MELRQRQRLSVLFASWLAATAAALLVRMLRTGNPKYSCFHCPTCQPKLSHRAAGSFSVDCKFLLDTAADASAEELLVCATEQDLKLHFSKITKRKPPSPSGRGQLTYESWRCYCVWNLSPHSLTSSLMISTWQVITGRKLWIVFPFVLPPVVKLKWVWKPHLIWYYTGLYNGFDRT